MVRHFLSENVSRLIVKKYGHRHQLLINSFVGSARLDLPRDKASSFKVADLDILAMEQTSGHLANEAVN
jgi:hypothetical protein